MKLIIAGVAAAGLVVLILGLNSKSDTKEPLNDEAYLDLCPHADQMTQEQCDRIDIRRQCGSDADCNNGQEKCCWNGCYTKSCRQTVKVSKSEKSGSCPISTYDPKIMCDFIYPEYQDCRHDSECADNKKCCADGPCAFRKCKAPVEERKGSCPNFTYDREGCNPSFRETDFECKVDSDCKNQLQKCCRDKCFLLKCFNAA